MRSMLLSLGLIAVTSPVFAQVPVASPDASSEYKIANRFLIGGEGGWDFISADTTDGRLFVSHSTQVEVVDGTKGTVLGVIPDTKGVHGIAVANDLGKGFISNGKDSSVTVFDLKTLKVLAKITVTGQNPDAIMYDGFSKQVFAFNAKSNNATVIDAKENKVISTIAFEGNPEVPVTDEAGRIFVNIESKSLVDLFDAKTFKIEQRWPIAPGEEASGLAIDVTNHRLFIVCSNKLMVIMDSQTGKVITSLPIGDRVDGVAFDPLSHRAFSSNGEGTITIIQEVNKDSFKVAGTITTQKGARTIALNTKTHHIYLPTAEFGETPAATAENPRPRPAIKSGTFTVLDIAPVK